MALHDVDPRSLDRGSPLPSSHDVQMAASVKAHKTKSVNYITDASTLSLMQGALNGQFTLVQEGSFTTSSHIVAPAAPGAGNYGTSTVTVTTQAHGLSYTPGLLAYLTSGTTYAPLPLTTYATGALWYTFRAAVDATNVYIYLDIMGYGTSNDFQPGFAFKWYLTQQTPT